MIVVNFSDGIGNQLFQLAMGLALGELRKEKILFKNKKNFKLEELDIQIDFIEHNYFWNKYTRLIKPILIIDPVWERIEIPRKNIELSGYWAFPDYFESIKKDLEKLQLKNPSKNYLEHLDQIDFSKSCAIHVRRGDYLNKEYEHLFAVKDQNYYSTGYNYLKSLYNLEKVYVFSNDIDWCKKNLHFQIETKFMDSLSEMTDIEELFLMSKFKNIVISNSTFSWWSSYLNAKDIDKNIIVPEKWYILESAQKAYEYDNLLYLENIIKS